MLSSWSMSAAMKTAMARCRTTPFVSGLFSSCFGPISGQKMSFCSCRSLPLIACWNGRVMVASLLAFVAFSLAASAVYILNDLMDISSDRLHPTKKNRPLASGAISIPVGLSICPIVLGASIGVAALLPLRFLGMVMLYLLISTAYTFSLKKKLMVDVLCLAGLYTLRIVAGGAATGIPMTPWLLAFSMFMFLSLAFVKRYTELDRACQSEGEKLAGRGYRAIDLEMIRSVGPASAYVAVLVICLYINDRQSTALYHRPEWLWLLCPVILYWISRIWFLRSGVNCIPILFSSR